MRGIRVLKTAIAAIAAVYAAAGLGLANPLSAGLLAVLGVDVTRRKTLMSAFVRLVASSVGLLFAIFLFRVFGFQVWVLGLFIGGVYPVLARLGLSDGIVTSTVIMIHVIAEASVDRSVVLNEVLLLLVGFGTATVVNLAYMPSGERQLQAARERAEAAMSGIFREIASALRDPGRVWDGGELLEAECAIRSGAELARRAAENALFQPETEWATYFAMRERQLDEIRRMLVLIARVYERLPYGGMAAELFDGMSRDVKSEYYAGAVEHRLAELEETFRGMPLPETREEFETRSAILQLCLDLKHYLAISKEMKKRPRERDRRGLGKTK